MNPQPPLDRPADPLRHSLIDTAIILAGVLLSSLIVAFDGNGQSVLSAALVMLFVAAVTGMIAFIVARFARTPARASAATFIITELLFLLGILYALLNSRSGREHAAEELSLVPVVFLVCTAPAILLSSIGFARLALRFYQWKAAQSKR